MTDQVQFATFERTPRRVIDLPAIAPSYHQLTSPVRSAIVHARRLLLSRQRRDGSWAGHQIGDASLPSQLILLLAYLGREDGELADQAANAILRDQLECGGWPSVPGGRIDLSVSVQAYFALKLAGHKPNRPHMAAARQVIRQSGGADGADATTRMFLALFGQIDHDLHGAKNSCIAAGPRRAIEMAQGVRELFVARPIQWPVLAKPTPERTSSFLDFVRQLIAEYRPDGCDASTTSVIWEERLRQFVVIDDERDEARPCLATSPTWDTALVRAALLESGSRVDRLGSPSLESRLNPAVAETMELAAIVRLQAAGNCRQRVPSALPPEIQLLGDERLQNRAANRQDLAESDAVEEANARFVEELLSRQNSDGGWSAGGPHDAASDPATTASVLESLAHQDFAPTHEAVGRGATYLRSAQRADGSWESAAGVRFIHGTSHAIRGLIAAGAGPDDPAVKAGVNWLLVHQQESGGWGEAAPSSPTHDEFIPAAAAAIQTAWAVTALVAAGGAMEDATLCGIQFLLETQEDDGDWLDLQFTLRDAAAERCYRNDLHSAAESLAALARWAVSAARCEPESMSMRLKLVAEEVTLA
ncbi:MAG TPA: prenyltransferase/squalene oxidase repeat-containing protein [Lacipirellulaceae bacterium]